MSAGDPYGTAELYMNDMKRLHDYIVTALACNDPEDMKALLREAVNPPPVPAKCYTVLMSVKRQQQHQE